MTQYINEGELREMHEAVRIAPQDHAAPEPAVPKIVALAKMLRGQAEYVCELLEAQLILKDIIAGGNADITGQLVLQRGLRGKLTTNLEDVPDELRRDICSAVIVTQNTLLAQVITNARQSAELLAACCYRDTDATPEPPPAQSAVQA